MLKLFRRTAEGVNPDLEVGRFLTEKASFPHTPHVAGYIEYRPHRNAEGMTVAVLQGYRQNQGDAWRYTLDALGRYFEWVLAHPEVEVPPMPNLLDLSEKEPSTLAQETIGPYLMSARLLGQRTAELHLALASDQEDAAFVPEPFSLIYQRSLYHSMRSFTTQVMQLLRQRFRVLGEDLRADAQRVVDLEQEIIRRFGSLRQRRLSAMRIRCHGDYHLGQVLYTGDDFVIIDFEGEPARPLGERRLKRSPLRDVAGMIRSFHYATHAALQGQAPTVIRTEDLPLLEQWADFWYYWVSASFLGSYLEAISQSSLLPESREELKLLLDAYLLEKAVYEVVYELNNRPDWLVVPLQGILQLLDTET
jgi:maltose alpha-D-glucosyltransferase/alpha-amylase